MLTGVGTQGALIDILIACGASVSGRTGADGLAIDWVGVTVRTLLTGIADTRVIKVTEQTCATMRALAEE